MMWLTASHVFKTHGSHYIQVAIFNDQHPIPDFGANVQMSVGYFNDRFVQKATHNVDHAHPSDANALEGVLGIRFVRFVW